MSRRFILNLVALAFGFLIGAASTWANADSGFSWKGTCFKTADEAVNSWASEFPMVADGKVTSLTYFFALFDNSGGFVFETEMFDPVAVAWFTTSGSGNFQICTIPDSLVVFPQNDVALVIAGVVLWTIGFSVGQKR